VAIPWKAKQWDKVYDAAENIRAQEKISWMVLNHVPPTPACFNPTLV